MGLNLGLGLHRRGDPFAVAGFRPPLVSDFSAGYHRALGAGTDFDSLYTFARTGTATYFDSTGTLQTAADGEARTDAHYWDGSGWVRGLQIESDSKTQLLHTTNALVTQSVTVTAQLYSLQFVGSGSVTLSGAHSATLNGAGAGEQNRVYLSFTPSAGTLTLTVSGDVTDAQLEAGMPSSYIPNLAGSGTATRNGETLFIASVLLPYSPTAMTIVLRGVMTYADEDDGAQIIFANWQSGSLDYLRQYVSTSSVRTGEAGFLQRSSGTIDIVAGGAEYAPGFNVPFSIASRHGATFINGAVDGTALTENTTPTALPDLSGTDFELAPNFNGFLTDFRVWDTDLGDTGIAEASA